MKYTELVFDLYGTLVDIHTEEDAMVWEKTAMYFGFYGAKYTADELQREFKRELERREGKAGQSYECFPDIPFEQVMDRLFQAKGIRTRSDILGRNAAQVFRIVSIEYIRMYPNVLQAISYLREKGFRLWLLSNAQSIFTAYELHHLGLADKFDGVYLSSDYGYRKPDIRFFRAFLENRGLNPAKCLMIGNDRQTDISGARAAGMDTLYIHTNLTPQDQEMAAVERHPKMNTDTNGAYEYEGWDWQELSRLIADISMRGETI